ncbi:hypothetical protein NGRA_0781 [Nosema granulosis]|uniref:Uncharacterized protein n=1 Tax=Nosema granulosis TaxID=83296 RepID=A0A9P6H1E2_9MICR|nr:hypothetical protein NGRA_0781 [Nosema granulosis]
MVAQTYSMDKTIPRNPKYTSLLLKCMNTTKYTGIFSRKTINVMRANRSPSTGVNLHKTYAFKISAIVVIQNRYFDNEKLGIYINILYEITTPPYIIYTKNLKGENSLKFLISFILILSQYLYK